MLGETSKILIDKTSNLYNYYKQEEIEERYNCNFGVNPEYEKRLHKDGFEIVGKDLLGEARILELPNMKFLCSYFVSTTIKLNSRESS